MTVRHGVLTSIEEHVRMGGKWHTLLSGFFYLKCSSILSSITSSQLWVDLNGQVLTQQCLIHNIDIVIECLSINTPNRCLRTDSCDMGILKSKILSLSPNETDAEETKHQATTPNICLSLNPFAPQSCSRTSTTNLPLPCLPRKPATVIEGAPGNTRVA